MTYLEILHLAELALWARQDKEEKLMEQGSKIIAPARLAKINEKLEEVGKLILAEEKKILA